MKCEERKTNFLGCDIAVACACTFTTLAKTNVVVIPSFEKDRGCECLT